MILMEVIEETHMNGLITIESEVKTHIGDLGIQIAKDGRIWICIDGVAFIRFKPLSKNLISLMEEKD